MFVCLNTKAQVNFQTCLHCC